MKNLPLLLLFAFTSLCTAQDGSFPAPTNIPGQEYPRVLPDHSIIFRVMAPDAQKVQVQIGKTYEMTKDADGNWSVTIPPQTVGFHYYYLVIDGFTVSDPASESFFGVGKMSSAIEVPEAETESAFYTVQNVPHGVVRLQRYFSKVSGQWRRCFVYTPPGYDVNPKMKYPVLFLMPGGGEDDRGWFNQGKADIIIDNLIAEGKEKPMIVVTDNQFSALKPGEKPLVLFRGGGPGKGPRPDFSNYGLTYTEVLLTDLLPLLENTYQVKTGREAHAMAGLSMGGMQTFISTVPHLNQFAFIGGFSPGLPQAQIDAIKKDPAGFNKQVRVLFLGTGTVEKANNPNIFELHNTLDSLGVHNVYFESQGTAHEWLSWRRDLREFAPLLFNTPHADTQ
jgi:enterochelin esterase-like enzyme